MKELRLFDMIVWCCMLVLAALMLMTVFGCGLSEKAERAITVAEKALEHVEEIQAAGAEIKEKAEEGDWLGVTNDMLIGAGAVLTMLGGTGGAMAVRKKLKGTGDGKTNNS
jgi:hypothetical protein